MLWRVYSSHYRWSLSPGFNYASIQPNNNYNLSKARIQTTNNLLHSQHDWPWILSSSFQKHSPVLSSFTTYYTTGATSGAGTALTLPVHLSSLPAFSWVRVTRSLLLYVCFVDRCLSFCTFAFGHCVVCSSSIHGFLIAPYTTLNFNFFTC